MLNDHRESISRYLSQKLNADVSIGQLNAQWDGLKPILDVDQLRIDSRSGLPIFSLAQAHMQLDLLDSLLHLRPVWSVLTLHQAKVGFVQSTDGHWGIPGLPALDEKNPDESAQLDTLIDMLLLSRRIAFHKAHFDFQFASGDKTLLQSPSAVMENAKGFHRLSMQVDVDNRPKTLQLLVEASGDPRRKQGFTSSVYLQLNQFPTNEPIAAATAFLLRGIKAEVHSEGTLSASLWLTSRPLQEGFDLVGQVGVQRLNLPVLGRELALDKFSSDVVGSWFYGGKWNLALQNLGASINQNTLEKVNIAASANSHEAPLVVQLRSLNLQRLNQALDETGVLGEGRLRNVMRQLHPSGELHNLEVSIPLQKPSDWQLRANLVQVASGAWQGVPALGKLDGFVQAGQRGGHVDIDSRAGFSMFYYPTYTQAMEFERAKGQVAWQIHPEENQVYVNSGALEFFNGTEQAKGYMWLALPWRHGTGDIDLYLHVGAKQLNASLYRKYVPAVVPPSLLTWLDKSIGANNAGIATQGGFVYRGTLNTPKHNARTHQLYLDVNHAELQYHPDWPRLHAINGRVLVDGENVTATLDNAKLFASDVGPTQVSVRPNSLGEGTLLQVDGNVKGAASDGLRILRESMLRQYIGANMDTWQLEGALQTQVNISVPLTQGAPGAAQQVDIDLQSPFFALGNLKLSARDITGRISYNQDAGLSSENLRARLFDEPVEVLLSTQKKADRSQTWVDIAGEVDSRALANWSLRPEVLYLQGKIPYKAHVELNHRSSDKRTAPPLVSAQSSDMEKAFAVVTVSSQLAGVEVDLPEPYGKSRSSERPLIFKMALHEQSSLIALSYGDHLQALFELKPANSNTLYNANIALDSVATLSESPQFLLSGKLPVLDIEPWKKAQQQYVDYTQQLDRGSIKKVVESNPLGNTEPDVLVAGLPFHAAVLLGRYQVGPLLLENIDVRAERLPGAWVVRFANTVTEGDAYLPNEKNKPMQINLKNLHLDNQIISGPVGEPISSEEALQAASSSKPLVVSLDPRTLPVSNITVRELYLDNDNYGSWSLQIRPNDKGVLFDNIHGTVRGITVSGLDNALAGATLSWQLDDLGARTHFSGTLSATDISVVLQQWQKPDMLESSVAQFRTDIEWVGDPQDFSLKKIKGDIDIWLEKGRFKRNPSIGSDGFLRLMAILNFDSLARRLRLDFSDLYQSGLAYDHLSGKVSFEPGTMTFAEPLVVQTPSSRLQMAGTLDLEHEKINTRLVATLPIAGNFTFVTALVTGLPAAAGIYLVSKLFKKQVDQAASVSYSIRGGWDDPKMNFDRLFESEESLRESVKPSETPKKTKKYIKKTNARPEKKAAPEKKAVSSD